MRHISASIISVMTICVAVSACGGSANRSKSGDKSRYAKDGTFTMVLAEDNGVYDPYRGNAFGVSKLAYDSLVNLQPSGRFVSGLASKWTADAHSATFTLRPGITCSDGSALTASQIAADINFLSDPKNKSLQYGVSIPAVPITAKGDDRSRTVEVVAKEKFGFLLNTIGQAPVMCARGLKDPKILTKSSDGTGPFVLTNVVAGQSFTFTRRGDYAWGPDGATTKAAGTPAKVVIKIVTNESTAANLLLSGAVNMAKISGEDRARLDAQGLRKFKRSASGAGLRFNEQPDHPGQDQRIRQALVQALDLDQLVKVSTGGTGGPATGLVTLEPKACTGNTVIGQLPKHDVAAAETQLDQAGWTKSAAGVRVKNDRPLAIDLHYMPGFSNYEKPTAEIIAQSWKSLGVQVKLTQETRISRSAALYQTGNWDATIGLGDAYLPSQWVPYVSGPFPPKGTNLGGQNKQYDSLAAKAQAMTGPHACAVWNKAEQALYQAVDLAPISSRPGIYYLNKALAYASGYDVPVPTSIRVLQ